MAQTILSIVTTNFLPNYIGTTSVTIVYGYFRSLNRIITSYTVIIATTIIYHRVDLHQDSLRGMTVYVDLT